MKIILHYLRPAILIWLITALLAAVCFSIYISEIQADSSFLFIVAGVATIVCSIPAIPALIVIMLVIERSARQSKEKIAWFVFTIFIMVCLFGIFSGFLISITFEYGENAQPFFESSILAAGILSFSAGTGILFNLSLLKDRFTNSLNKTNTYMEEQAPLVPGEISPSPLPQNTSMKKNILLKAGITAILILLMMIPMVFIGNLVKERQQLQQDIVTNVNSKWSSAQTISNPYLVIPYTYSDEKGYTTNARRYLILLPEKLTVNGQMNPDTLHRSLHEVLLYRSDIKMEGNFQLSRLLKNKTGVNLILSEAKICFGISDFKGIEEKVNLTFNGSPLDFTPGLPVTTIDTIGLSSPVTIIPEDLDKNISFALSLKIRGSEGLQFLPLSGNSKFSISSAWQHPSFIGNISPADRNITENGFTANWNFNQANLPFDLLIKEDNIHRDKIAFGVSMVEPVDEYSQTMRCVKYAILIIGLTFALSFVIELMQKKPVHPIQYILIGLALAIFYTLLLSLSEFIFFDYAYIIASVATILLIAMYVQNHFKSWKVGGLFTGILAVLYSFIYVLIKLEDTALLVGSIALFIILALVMYATRKINWYDL